MKPFIFLSILLSMFALQGCGLVAGAAIGGTAGYLLSEEGYEVQSPVTKE